MAKMLLATLVAPALIAGIAGCLPSSGEMVVCGVSTAECTATLSKRNSGVMSKGSTMVSVRLNSLPDNDTHGLVVFAIAGDQPVEMKWIDLHKLALSCGSCTARDVNFEAVKAGEIVIIYSDGLRID